MDESDDYSHGLNLLFHTDETGEHRTDDQSMVTNDESSTMERLNRIESNQIALAKAIQALQVPFSLNRLSYLIFNQYLKLLWTILPYITMTCNLIM